MSIMQSMIARGYTKGVIPRDLARLHAFAMDAIAWVVLLTFKRENGES